MNKMTDELERDPNYDAIMEFIDLCYTHFNKSYSNHLIYTYMNSLKHKWDTEFIYDLFHNKKILHYNFCICDFIKSYCVFIEDNRNIYYRDKIKILYDYEPKFRTLLRIIMTNNWQNIRRDFTLDIIYYSFIYKNYFKYFRTNIELIYLLETIDPKKIPLLKRILEPMLDRQIVVKEISEYIYYKKTELRLLWMGAITRMF